MKSGFRIADEALKDIKVINIKPYDGDSPKLKAHFDLRLKNLGITIKGCTYIIREDGSGYTFPPTTKNGGSYTHHGDFGGKVLSEHLAQMVEKKLGKLDPN